MSLNRRLKKLLILKLYVSMKKFLTLKPSQTQSQTNVSIKNQDCSKDTANLAAVENMVQRQFQRRTRDASSLESNNFRQTTF